ncbi:MAG: hypothetical protein H0T73_18450 [Ardenticatenales bacterium]|nr:hypothetical protein [Ardenticatenales bacterium]
MSHSKTSKKPDSWGGSFNQQTYREYLTMARSHIHAKEFSAAQRWLERAQVVNPRDPEVWRLMARATESNAEKEQYLQELLRLVPNDAEGRRDMAVLKGLINPEELLPVGHNTQARNPVEPEQVKAQLFLCPSCGGLFKHDPAAGGLRCERCGTVRPVIAPNAADNEQPLELVLPTVRGHRWAEAHHLLTCSQCGAESLLPPTESTSLCPFCGSDVLVASKETAGLLPPQAIAPLQVTEREALALASQWLNTALGRESERAGVKLRPAYYPFWTFDALYHAAWNESGIGESQVVQYALPCDDILVSGNKHISDEMLAWISPFALKEVVEFRPEFLAGWPTILYDSTVADASIVARRIIVDRTRRVIEASPLRRYMPGRFDNMTYKQILLPLWVGTYRYQDRSYALLVNGQTRSVGGKRNHL